MSYVSLWLSICAAVYARMEITPHFVIDVSALPCHKSSKLVQGIGHRTVEPSMRIIEAYGFTTTHLLHLRGFIVLKPFCSCFQARWEAEAEPARMSKAGIIDPVHTDDSDSLLFGAQNVTRE